MLFNKNNKNSFSRLSLCTEMLIVIFSKLQDKEDLQGYKLPINMESQELNMCLYSIQLKMTRSEDFHHFKFNQYQLKSSSLNAQFVNKQDLQKDSFSNVIMNFIMNA